MTSQPSLVCKKTSTIHLQSIYWIGSKHPWINMHGEVWIRGDILLCFLDWMDSVARIPDASGMEPELEVGSRRKTPERRLVWWRMRLLPGCLTATTSADLLVEELPADVADLMKRGEDPGSRCWIPSRLSIMYFGGLWKGSRRGMFPVECPCRDES